MARTVNSGRVNSGNTYITTSGDDSLDSSDENLSLLGSVAYRPATQDTALTSIPGAVFIVINACIGAGLLNFPAAYMSAGGPVSSIVIQMIMLVFIIGSLLILALCSDIRGCSTYQDIISEMCGPWGRVFCEVCIIIYCYGTTITFFIIMGDQMDLILKYIFHDSPNDWFLNRKLTVTLLGVFIVFPLCVPKKIDFLKYPSSVGVIASLYVCLVVVLNYYILPPHPVSPDPPGGFSSWTRVFSAIPTMCFAFQCHISAVPVYGSLKKRNVKNFSIVVLTAVGVSCMTYILCGTFGYLTFRNNVCADVLESYSADIISVLVARLMILTNMLTTYPILHFCGRLAIETMYKNSRGMASSDIDIYEKTRRLVETTAWVLSSLVLALLLPDIGVVISVIGGLAAIFIFVFPGLCLFQFVLKHSATSVRKQRMLLSVAVLLIAMGTFIFGESITSSLMTDFGIIHKWTKC